MKKKSQNKLTLAVLNKHIVAQNDRINKLEEQLKTAADPVSVIKEPIKKGSVVGDNKEDPEVAAFKALGIKTGDYIRYQENGAVEYFTVDKIYPEDKEVQLSFFNGSIGRNPKFKRFLDCVYVKSTKGLADKYYKEKERAEFDKLGIKVGDTIFTPEGYNVTVTKITEDEVYMGEAHSYTLNNFTSGRYKKVNNVIKGRIEDVFKVGDIVVSCFSSSWGEIGEILSESSEGMYITNFKTGDKCVGGTMYSKSNLRKATPEEILKYKNELQFKVGDIVVSEYGATSGEVGEILSDVSDLYKDKLPQRTYSTTFNKGSHYSPLFIRHATDAEKEQYLKEKTPKFKIGDIVVCTYNNLNKVTKLVKDVSGSFGKPPGTNFELEFEFWVNHKSCHKEHLRHATEEQKAQYNKEKAPIFEVGDYIKSVGGTCLFKIEKVSDNEVFINQNGFLYPYKKERQTKASVEQIKEHLLQDAANRGFVVGAKVTHNNNTFKITKLVFNKDKFDGPVSCAVLNCKEKYFIFAVYGFGQGYQSPIDKLSIVNNDDIIVKVDGVEYKADFSKCGYVSFGCAEIDNHLLRRAHSFMSDHGKNVAYGNRSIDGVMIGKGYFTLSILQKIVNVLNRK